MERIIVIGCCGAGKSTFARRLHDKTGLELVHLDKLHWSSNWVESDRETMKQRVQEVVEKPKWIIDGNYSGTMDIRIEKADTILYLDYPIWKCLCGSPNEFGLITVEPDPI